MRPMDNEEELLEKIRQKLGPGKKVDERSELERLFGKREEDAEARLRKKLVKPSLKVGDTVDINIDKLAFGGEGLGRHNNFPIFVADTVPGDAVKVKLTQVSKDMCRGELVEILAKSSNRIPARCPLFEICGGCQLQSLVYTAQLKAKQIMAADVLKRIGGIELKVRNVLRSPEQFGYRIRTRLQVAEVAGEIKAGYFARHSKNLIPIETCPLLVDSINRVVEKLSVILPSPGTAPVPREIQLQTNSDATEVLIHLVGSEELFYVEAVLNNCQKHGLPVSGVSSSYKNRFHNAGQPVLTLQAGGTQFYASGKTFVKENRYLLKKMLNQAIMLSSPAADDTMLDLYCGSGFFSLTMAPFVKSVTGLEGSKDAITNAKEAAKSKKLDNMQFYACNDTDFFKCPDVLDTRFSLVVADPPRSGLHPDVLKGLIKMKPSKLLYVSCNPSTLARDLKALAAADFRIRVIQPIDMFPHTYHLENMVFLTHRYTGVQAANQVFMDLR